MFSKIRSLKANCILPSAVTPAQKVFCIITAFVGMSLASFAGYKTYQLGNSTEIVQNGVRSLSKCVDDSIAKIKVNSTIKQKMTNYGNKFFDKFENPKILAGVGCIFEFVGFWGIYTSSKETFSEITKTTKCCNIIRSTVTYAICVPIFTCSLIFGSIFIKSAYDKHKLLSLCSVDETNKVNDE